MIDRFSTLTFVFNCNSFQGYDTQVGELGSLMSGGQKQRIAIARAIIQNPKILLLDEATSALDPHTATLVQEMLDKVAKGRTTIVVTHRLSSIRKADQIVLIDKGEIVEKGTHFNLMNLQGKYYEMVRQDSMYQKLKEETDDSDGDEEEKVVRKASRSKSIQGPIASNNFSMFKDEVAKSEPINNWAIFCRIFLMARPEWGFILLGAIGSAVVGVSYPVFAVLLGNIYGAMQMPDPDDVKHEISIICICFMVVGLVVAFCLFLQTYLFNITGVILTTKLRRMVFHSMIKQDMAWFDEDSHSVGGLCAFLSGDAANVRAAVGQPIGGIISALATLICGIAVAMSYSWKLALVCLCFVPLVVFTVIFEAK